MPLYVSYYWCRKRENIQHNNPRTTSSLSISDARVNFVFLLQSLQPLPPPVFTPSFPTHSFSFIHISSSGSLSPQALSPLSCQNLLELQATQPRGPRSVWPEPGSDVFIDTSGSCALSVWTDNISEVRNTFSRALKSQRWWVLLWNRTQKGNREFLFSPEIAGFINPLGHLYHSEIFLPSVLFSFLKSQQSLVGSWHCPAGFACIFIYLILTRTLWGWYYYYPIL